MHHGTATGFETLTAALIQRFADNADRPELSLSVDDVGSLSQACADGLPRQLHVRVNAGPLPALSETASAGTRLDETWLSALEQRLPAGSQLLLDLPSATAAAVVAALRSEAPDATSSRGLAWTVLQQAGFLDLSDADFAQQISHYSPTTAEHWLRVVSWVASDPRLRTLVSLLQTQVFANNPSSVCQRTWLLLGTHPATNATTHSGNISGDVKQHVGAETIAAINSTMMSMRCRVLWYRLSALLSGAYQCNIDSLLDAEHLSVLDRWRQQEQQDSDNIAITRSWYESADIAPLFHYKGISLGRTREYDLFSLLLTQHFRHQAPHKP